MRSAEHEHSHQQAAKKCCNHDESSYPHCLALQWLVIDIIFRHIFHKSDRQRCCRCSEKKVPDDRFHVDSTSCILQCCNDVYYTNCLSACVFGGRGVKDFIEFRIILARGCKVLHLYRKQGKTVSIPIFGTVLELIKAIDSNRVMRSFHQAS